MFVTVRRYAGLHDATLTALADRGPEVAGVLASVPGSISVQLVRSRDGLVLLAIGRDEPSLVEVGRRFRAWADGEIEGFAATGEPDLWTGPVIGGVAGPEP